ncbi:hypothetical protein ACSPX5_09330 [Pseudomonas sp. HLG18]|uniref:hypothetical protein n=1 Tax=Pseudomonas sp. HLG18 TaxID=3449277 RepID=UPI003F749651
MSIGLALIKVLILFMSVWLVCTGGPKAWHWLFPNDTVEVADKSMVIKKAMIGEACNKESTDCKKNVLIIIGAIDDGTAKAIDHLAETATFDTVCFSSPGGSAGIAQDIGNWIKSRHFNTCMAERYKLEGGIGISNVQCLSACPYLLLMGKTRVALGSDFSIGVHRSGVTFDLCVCHFKVNEFWPYVSTWGYRDMLGHSDQPEIHQSLLSFSLDVDSTDIHNLTQAELKKYAVFNAGSVAGSSTQ